MKNAYNLFDHDNLLKFSLVLNRSSFIFISNSSNSFEAKSFQVINKILILILIVIILL